MKRRMLSISMHARFKCGKFMRMQTQRLRVLRHGLLLNAFNMSEFIGRKQIERVNLEVDQSKQQVIIICTFDN